MTTAVVFVVLVLLTFGIMLVAAAGARPSHRHDSAHLQAEEKGNALLRSWLTPEQNKQWTRDRSFEVTGCDTGTRYRITDSLSMNVLVRLVTPSRNGVLPQGEVWSSETFSSRRRSR
jgi:hypothetical protein